MKHLFYQESVEHWMIFFPVVLSASCFLHCLYTFGWQQKDTRPVEPTPVISRLSLEDRPKCRVIPERKANINKNFVSVTGHYGVY